jgi:hypothetical protein
LRPATINPLESIKFSLLNENKIRTLHAAVICYSGRLYAKRRHRNYGDLYARLQLV